MSWRYKLISSCVIIGGFMSIKSRFVGTSTAVLLITCCLSFVHGQPIKSKSVTAGVFQEALRTMGEAQEKWHRLDSQEGFDTFDPEYKSIAIEALKSNDSRMVLGALNVPLGEMHDVEDYIDTLKRLLGRKEHASVRAEAAFALGNIGPAAKGALSQLTQILNMDPDRRVREAAALALMSIGPIDEAVPALKKALQDTVETPVHAAR